jgi:multidrug efflux pump subunit AcrA (membrane-fusion protein)
VIVTLPNADGALSPGMSVTAWVPTGQTSMELTISKDAVLRNEIGPFIYVVRGGPGGGPAAAVPTPIELRFAIDDRVVVRSAPLSPGDQVIVEGNERLFPMAPVAPLNNDSGERPASQGSDH